MTLHHTIQSTLEWGGSGSIYRRYGGTIPVFLQCFTVSILVGWRDLFQWSRWWRKGLLQVLGLLQILVSYSQFHYIELCVSYVRVIVNICGS
jgi:hypothetical protein